MAARPRTASPKNAVSALDMIRWASLTDAKLKATDPRLRRSVIVHHDDGVLVLRGAFARRRGAFLVVFREHGGPEVFELDHVQRWAEYEYIYP